MFWKFIFGLQSAAWAELGWKGGLTRIFHRSTVEPAPVIDERPPLKPKGGLNGPPRLVAIGKLFQVSQKIAVVTLAVAVDGRSIRTLNSLNSCLAANGLGKAALPIADAY
jgi:hypothetical protein